MESQLSPLKSHKITIRHKDNNQYTTYPPSSAPVHHITPSNPEEPAQRTECNNYLRSAQVIRQATGTDPQDKQTDQFDYKTSIIVRVNNALLLLY